MLKARLTWWRSGEEQQREEAWIRGEKGMCNISEARRTDRPAPPLRLQIWVISVRPDVCRQWWALSRRGGERSLGVFLWPLRGPACLTLGLSHTLLDRWGREDSDGRVWMIPSAPQRPGDEFLAIMPPPPPPPPPVPPSLLPRACTLSPPPLPAHPLSYDNLFWLLTSCLSLIQYSGFSAIQPWPITTFVFGISVKALALISSTRQTASVSGAAVSKIKGLKGGGGKKAENRQILIFSISH